MTAARYNLQIEQGATFRQPLELSDPYTEQPWDLSGCTARMQMRSKIASTDILHEMTTENNGLIIDPLLGIILMQIDAAVTTTFKFANAVYDLELVKSDGDVIRLLAGVVLVSMEVTR